MFSDVPSRRTHLLLLLGFCVSHQIVSGTSLSAEGKQLTLVIDRPVTTPVRDVIANSGRPVRLDLRFKGLRQQTIDQAVESGVDLTVSTKFWCEHMGLPFHPTVEDKKWRASRYGYGAMLYKPRNYRVVYRL